MCTSVPHGACNDEQSKGQNSTKNSATDISWFPISLLDRELGWIQCLLVKHMLDIG